MHPQSRLGDDRRSGYDPHEVLRGRGREKEPGPSALLGDMVSAAAIHVGTVTKSGIFGGPLASPGRRMCASRHDSGSHSDRSGLASIGDVEFLEHAGDVELDGALADTEFFGDGAVPLAHGEMREDFEFAGIQCGQEVLVRPGRGRIEGDGECDPAPPPGDRFDGDSPAQGVQASGQLPCEGVAVDGAGPLVADLDQDVVAVAVPRDPHSGEHRLRTEREHDCPDHGPRGVRELGEAAACFDLAGRTERAERSRDVERRLRAHIEGSVQSHRLRFERAKKSAQRSAALTEIKALRTLFESSHGAYVEWLAREERLLQEIDKP